MRILGLELSSTRRSAAVLDAATARQGFASEGIAGNSHPVALMEQALRAVGMEREEIEAVAVGIGPGSYTGIRVAISLAQGWEAAAGVKLQGISSLDCLACQAWADGMRGEVDLAVDAQRGEFYLATYTLEDDDWRATLPLCLVSAAEVGQRAAQGRRVMGPDIAALLPNAVDRYPEAATLARLVADRPTFVAGERLEPIYLRPVAFVKAPPPRIFG